MSNYSKRSMQISSKTRDLSTDVTSSPILEPSWEKQQKDEASNQ